MPKYELSILLVRALFVAGWAILLAGIVSGFVLATELAESSKPTSDELDAGVFWSTLIGSIAAAIFASVLTWAAAYVVLLLSDIETNTG